ncbi:MAG: GNAT family N-acetyltransferase [Candidatus Eisenbacteria bacterium]|uniref:GNAT family N-acetyltransferase n=1 Tax=Eiseniibacteriota bacterium TaxID=2212470 RepID=A0A849SPH9_UNCEI|nr:GNAT family N-acetyltransferase [Candidatus Eisenbacteria bacterium]
MAVIPRPEQLLVQRLGPADLVEAFAYLDGDPVVNVYLEALLLRDSLGRPQDEFWGVRRDGELAGLLYLGLPSGAVLPVGDDAEAMRRLADVLRDRRTSLPRRFHVIGPATAVEPLVDPLARHGLTPRLDRLQRYMSVAAGDLAATEPLPDLRLACQDDIPMVFDSGAALRAEELEEDPRTVDPHAYRRRVEDECRDGHTWLWVVDGVLRFRSSVSAWTADAAQISGVYTPPPERRRGHARRALAELCRRLFPASRAACLFVNDTNTPAIALYESLGFRACLAWRSLFYSG